MTKTSEPGIISEHSEGERTRGNGAQTINAERHAMSDNSEHLRSAIADLETNAGFGFRRSSRAVFAMLLWMVAQTTVPRQFRACEKAKL